MVGAVGIDKDVCVTQMVRVSDAGVPVRTRGYASYVYLMCLVMIAYHNPAR